MKIGTNEISKIYLGTTEISKAYLGTNAIYEKGGSAVDEYTQLLLHFDNNLDDSSGKSIVTYSVQSTPNSAVYYENAHFGNGLNKFSGAYSYGEINYSRGDSSKYDCSAGITVEWWEYIDTTNSYNSKLTVNLVCVGRPGYGTISNTVIYCFIGVSNGSIKFVTGPNLNRTIDVTSSINDKSWNHICYQIDSSNNLYCFINGINILSANWGDYISWLTYLTYIQCSMNSTYDTCFVGMDELRISNIVRYSTDGFVPPTKPF